MQIATPASVKGKYMQSFASTRSVQIATFSVADFSIVDELCLHTLRADCNGIDKIKRLSPKNFASTRSVQIATVPAGCCTTISVNFASTRSVQIATPMDFIIAPSVDLCLHTLRADCNGVATALSSVGILCLHTLRADCNTLDG